MAETIPANGTPERAEPAEPLAPRLVRRVPTEAQREANRRNGKKSRGPRTPRGKAMVSTNALKHGILAREGVLRNILGGESEAEFEKMLESLKEAFGPHDSCEGMLVEKMALALWRTRRLRRHERALAEEELVRFERSPFMRERGGRIDAEVERIGARRCLPNAEELDKILRYEAALEREWLRCYALLEQRRQRRESEDAPPLRSIFHIG